MNIYIVDDAYNAKLKSIKTNFERLLENLRKKGHNPVPESHLEKAFNHIIKTENRFKYDLILVDHLFDRDFQSGNFINEKDKECGTGTHLCGELVKFDICTPIVLFTATGKDPDTIIKVLGDYGICYFFHKTQFGEDINGCLNKTISLPGFKRVWTVRKYELEKILKTYFRGLSSEDRYLFRAQCNWVIEHKTININERHYLLKDLLSDPLEEDKNALINKLKFFLDETEEFRFDGDLATIEYNRLYDDFFSSDTYEKTEEEINFKALNYLLDIFGVLEKFKKDEGIHFLNETHKRYKATIVHKNPKLENLIDKLILRRVALGLDKMNMFVEKIPEELYSRDAENQINKKKILAALLKHGSTNIYKTKKYKSAKTKKKQTNKKENPEINLSKVFNSGLGLESNQSDRDNLSFKTKVLDEEKKWIETYPVAAKKIRYFLDICKIDSDLDLHSFFANAPYFTDLTDFSTFISDSKLHYQSTDQVKEFEDDIDQIKIYFRDLTNNIAYKSVLKVLDNIQ